MDEELCVKIIDSKLCCDFILNRHYAHRIPSISIAFGLYYKDELSGILTIGKPASNSLCKGLFGEEYSPNVYELNRLYTIDGLPKNSLSQFVSKCLNYLKNTKIILVSYADSGMHHHGYIYQATNWIYTGKTKERTDKYVPGNKHSRHYTNEFNYLRKVRTSKYRYIYIPNKKFKKQIINLLKYPIEKYPKGDNVNYKVGDSLKTKVINSNTHEEFYE